MLPIYRETFHGIQYEAPRGRELTITAPAVSSTVHSLLTPHEFPHSRSTLLPGMAC